MIGLHFHSELYHKPLVPLLPLKTMDEMPIRIKNTFVYTLWGVSTLFSSYITGKNLNTADTFCKSPVSKPSTGVEQFEQEVKTFVDLIVRKVPATKKQLQEIQSEQHKDTTCHDLKQFCQNGWSNKPSMKGPLKLYAQVMEELSVNSQWTPAKRN